ncbi:biotin--[acetyl-CoA-carboxylase] ligase [Rathayibacter sp. CAU 1779]
MYLPLTALVSARVEWRERSTSTNDDLAEAVRLGPDDEWPEFSVLATDVQTAGRGRLGRSWSAPPGTMLATSVLLRPEAAGLVASESLGWLPLLAGLSMTRALRASGVEAELKWPNDILIGARKVCGILAEVLPNRAVIIGAGVNLSMTEAELPVPTATSMFIEGGETSPDLVLSRYLAVLKGTFSPFAGAGGDADASGIRDAVRAACTTLGQRVRVQLPGAADLVGVAVDIDGTGRLLIDADGRRTAVSAGDVTHLRY